MTNRSFAPRGHATTVRLLHWVTAVLVLATIPAGVIMVQDGLARPVQDSLFIFHKNVGVVILLIVLVRLAVRVASPPPPLPAQMPDWQRRTAVITHWVLYVLLVVMAVSGYVRVRAGGFPVEALDALGVPTMIPKSESVEDAAQWVHLTTRFIIVAFILLHVGAALQHALLRRDGVFQRMWPPYRP